MADNYYIANMKIASVEKRQKFPKKLKRAWNQGKQAQSVLKTSKLDQQENWNQLLSCWKFSYLLLFV